MISKAETIKDTIQVVVESGAAHVGKIASIITAAVRDVAHEIGEFGTDIFEAAEDAKRARAASGGTEVEEENGGEQHDADDSEDK